MMPPRAPSPVAYVSDPAAIAQTLYDLIESARSSIVLQMYLFCGNGETEALRARPNIFPYAHTVADWLVDRRRRSPEIDIVVLLDTQTLDDPGLTRRKSGPLARQVIEDAGIPVLSANLFRNTFNRARRFPPVSQLHDGRYRAVPPASYVRAQQRWQTWHNLEDHRKNLVIDEGAWAAVTSHNLMDIASDWHENLFLVGAPGGGGVWEQIQQALTLALELPQRLTPEARERIVALAARPPKSSAGDVPREPPVASLRALGDPSARPPPSPAPLEVLTGGEVRERLVSALAELRPGDRVRAASTYFSDVGLLDALIAAAARGVHVQVLVDDCAGLPLDRFPLWFVRTFVNFRVVERARRAASSHLEIRVFPSGAGAMMHLKTAAFVGERSLVIGGQANYTPNSFSGAWLETGLVVHDNAAVLDGFMAQLTALWNASRPPPRRDALSALFLRVLLWLVERLVFRF
jgi:phosphatidylserine/phosphatidylglycerophosphate/cardiolipin synthase-like enzyme